MTHLDDLIEEFDGEEGMFHLGPETQAAEDLGYGTIGDCRR